MLIRFFAGAAEAAGTDTLEVDAAGHTVDSLRAQLGAGNDRLAKVLVASSLLADGQRRSEGPLDDVTQLDVLPPFAGG
ncbi:MAG TPA: molybdopterin synthase sulfur carrier subunit [Janibacter terrae]|nr:molybdopterin synthase sulfur carrier subunit [Janibacter terrae]